MFYRSCSTLCLLLSLLFVSALPAVDAGVLNTSFVPKIFTNAQVEVSARAADGKVYFGGNFDWVNGQPADWLVRFNADGSVDQGFNPVRPANADQLLALAPLPNGKVLVGYFFALKVYAYAATSTATVPNPAAAFHYSTGAYVIRLNADGSIDSSFATVYLGTDWSLNYGLGLPDRSTLSFIQPLSSGKILLGGSFQSVNETSTIHNLVRVNGDGTIDKTFKTTVNGAVQTAMVCPDGCTLIGGRFTKVNKDKLAFGLVKLKRDGKRDPTFNPSGKLKSPNVARIAQGQGNTLLVAAVTDSATSSGFRVGQPKSHLAILSAKGALQRHAATDVSGNPVGLSLYGASTAMMATAADPAIYVANLAPGTTVFAPLQAVKTTASSAPKYALAQVTELPYGPAGVVLFGNTWLGYGQSGIGTNVTPSMTGFEPLQPQGGTATQPALWVGRSAGVQHIAAAPGGKILASGWFAYGLTADNYLVERQGLAKLDQNGFVDGGFAPARTTATQMLANADGGVTVIGTNDDEKAVSSSGGNLFQLTATGDFDTAFTITTATQEPLLGNSAALVRQQDGKLVVGGSVPGNNLIATNGVPVAPHPILRRFAANGALDAAFAPTFSNSAKNSWGYIDPAHVIHVALDTNGALLVTGVFDKVNDVSVSNAVRILANGTVDAAAFTTPPLGGFTGLQPRAGGGYLFTAPRLNVAAVVPIPQPVLVNGTGTYNNTGIAGAVITKVGSGSLTLAGSTYFGTTTPVVYSGNLSTSIGGNVTIAGGFTGTSSQEVPVVIGTGGSLAIKGTDGQLAFKISKTAEGDYTVQGGPSSATNVSVDLTFNLTGANGSTATLVRNHTTGTLTLSGTASIADAAIDGGTITINDTIYNGGARIGLNTAPGPQGPLSVGAEVAHASRKTSLSTFLTHVVSGSGGTSHTGGTSIVTSSTLTAAVNHIASGGITLQNTSAVIGSALNLIDWSAVSSTTSSGSLQLSNLSLNQNLAMPIFIGTPSSGDGHSPFSAITVSGASDAAMSVAELVPSGSAGVYGNTYGVKFISPLPGGGWAAMTFGLKDKTTDKPVSLVILNANGSINRSYTAPEFTTAPNIGGGYFWWGPQTQADFVYDMIVLDDGSIVVAGNLWAVNGEARSGLAKLASPNVP